MNNNFREFMELPQAIRVKEPLAETLGVFRDEGGIFEYSYTDVVKLAGHSCPSVTGAWLCCQEALAKLYPDDTPVRGEVSVTVYGEPDKAAYGVMSQVFGFITGAAPATGFKGLGTRFKRKDLLQFSNEKPDPKAMCFRFSRVDNDASVLVRFYPWLIPFPEEKVRKTAELMDKVLAGSASVSQQEEFRNLWMEKIKQMLIERKDIENWLKVDC